MEPAGVGGGGVGGEASAEEGGGGGGGSHGREIGKDVQVEMEGEGKYNIYNIIVRVM